MAIRRNDGYHEIGPKCNVFESRLDIGEVTALRDFVMYDYFMKVPKISVYHDDDMSKVSHAKLFPNKFSEDIDDMPSVFGSAMIKNIDTDIWRMIIMQTRSRRRSENLSQQRIVSRMNVEVMDNQIVEAVKKVQIVRGVGELTADAIVRQMDNEDGGDTVPLVRKAYERYMTTDDCEKAVEFLGKITQRIVAVG